MRSGIAADAAAALLFRVFSQPALLFPPPGHAQDLNGVRQSVYGFPRHAASPREQVTLTTLQTLQTPLNFYLLKRPAAFLYPVHSGFISRRETRLFLKYLVILHSTCNHLMGG